jgi:hypothetical protein
MLPAVMRPVLGFSPSGKSKRADVAQLVEQLIRNQQVIGSSPIVGSNLIQYNQQFMWHLRREAPSHFSHGACSGACLTFLHAPEHLWLPRCMFQLISVH